MPGNLTSTIQFGKGQRTVNDIFRVSRNSKGRTRHQQVLTEDQFRALVLYECARCDRNHHQFSLIQIEFQGNTEKKRTDELSKRILKRIRTTDEAGWLSAKSLGVFLPETGREGASKFARAVCGDFPYQIYTYPDFRTVESAEKDTNMRQDNDNNKNDRRTGDMTQHENGKNRGISDNLRQSNPPCRVSITQDVESVIHPKGLPAWKRLIDILGAATVLTLSSPLFLMVAAHIKVVSKGPVFFKQERIGYLGCPFTIYKFRTMKTDANCKVHEDHLKNLIDSDKVLTKLDEGNDSRLIPFAGVIRKSCLDELPQLINVLKGDMSLVGPRPLLSYEAEEFTAWQRQRMHAVPGMTGLWQVSGKNRLTFSQMMRLDACYSKNATLLIDMTIFLKTIPAIFAQVSNFAQQKVPGQGKEHEKRSVSIWNRSVSSLMRQLFL